MACAILTNAICFDNLFVTIQPDICCTVIPAYFWRESSSVEIVAASTPYYQWIPAYAGMTVLGAE